MRQTNDLTEDEISHGRELGVPPGAVDGVTNMRHARVPRRTPGLREQKGKRGEPSEVIRDLEHVIASRRGPLKVSAVISTYNRRTYVFRAIDSVLAQTVPVDEIIVVDDGSSDGTAHAIRSHYGSRVIVCSQENMGLGASRRRGLEEAQGEWVAFLDDDDEWLPDRNAAFLRAIAAVPQNVAWIFGNTQFVTDGGNGGTIFGENGLVIDRDLCVFDNPLSPSSGLVWDHARPRACLPQSSLIRKSALMEMECFREKLRHSEDLLASLQIASRYSFAAIPPAVTKLYRTSDLISLESSGHSSADHYRARLLGYALTARTAGHDPWGRLYAQSVRELCKVRAKEDLPIRRLALDQFKFGISVRSIAFLGAAILGPLFFRFCFAAKRKLRAIRQQG